MLNSHSLTVLRATCADTIPKILLIPKIPVQTIASICGKIVIELVCRRMIVRRNHF